MRKNIHITLKVKTLPSLGPEGIWVGAALIFGAALGWTLYMIVTA